jgi:hypothetical protein
MNIIYDPRRKLPIGYSNETVSDAKLLNFVISGGNDTIFDLYYTITPSGERTYISRTDDHQLEFNFVSDIRNDYCRSLKVFPI